MADQGFPVGGREPIRGGGMDLRHRHFLVKMFVKVKELGPIGGRAPEIFVCRSTNDLYIKKFNMLMFLQLQNVKVQILLKLSVLQDYLKQVQAHC